MRTRCAAVLFAGLLLTACRDAAEVEPFLRATGHGQTDRESAGTLATPTPTWARDQRQGWVTRDAKRAWQNRHGTEGEWIAGYFLPRDWECYETRREDFVLRWKLVSKGGGDITREELVGKALAALEGATPEGLSNPLERVRLRVREAHVEGVTVYLDFGPGIYATNSMGTCGGSAMAVQLVATVHHYFPEEREVCVLVKGTPSGEDGDALVFHDGVACPIPLNE